MSEHIRIPADDLEALVKSGVQEATRAIVKSVTDYVRSADDDDADADLPLSSVRLAIANNSWDASDLELDLTLDDVTNAISENGWSAEDLDIERENTVAEAVHEIGHTDVLGQVADAMRDHVSDPWREILATAWHVASDDTRKAFLTTARGLYPTTFECIAPPPVDHAAVQRLAVAEVTAKLAALLAG